MVLIFHLGFGQRGVAGGAPVDGLFAPVNRPAQKKFAKLGDDGGHVSRGHGEVGPLPVPQHPQTLEFFPLDVDELFGVGPAAGPHLHLGEEQSLGLQFLVHLVLDGKPVAVPARDIGTVKPHHLPGFDDDVL
jgi:hypothetical protein